MCMADKIGGKQKRFKSFAKFSAPQATLMQIYTQDKNSYLEEIFSK